jgi:hypothetical protein
MFAGLDAGFKRGPEMYVPEVARRLACTGCGALKQPRHPIWRGQKAGVPGVL